jgi:release factor glutamine methyltransferase
MSQKKEHWTVLSMMEWASSYFEKKEIPNPRLSIEWLLSDTLQIKRLDLYLQYDRPLTSDELEDLRQKVKRRAEHEPLQYITGSADFLNCTIQVDKRVLIPRPETEQLTEIILNDYISSKDESIHLLDIGTGSGCIPIAIAKERKQWICKGVDISADALELAAANAKLNDVDVLFEKDDLRSMKETGMFDVIISNPPYISPGEKEEMDLQVKGFEPDLALFHENPVSVYSDIVRFAHSHLKKKGALYLECNATLADQILAEVKEYFPGAVTLPDYDGKQRFVRAIQS